MRAHNTSIKASVPIEIEFTDKPMTPYGGLVLSARFFEKLHLRSLLVSVLPDQRTSYFFRKSSEKALPGVDFDFFFNSAQASLTSIYSFTSVRLIIE